MDVSTHPLQHDVTNARNSPGALVRVPDDLQPVCCSPAKQHHQWSAGSTHRHAAYRPSSSPSKRGRPPAIDSHKIPTNSMPAPRLQRAVHKTEIHSQRLGEFQGQGNAISPAFCGLLANVRRLAHDDAEPALPILDHSEHLLVMGTA